MNLLKPLKKYACVSLQKDQLYEENKVQKDQSFHIWILNTIEYCLFAK